MLGAFLAIAWPNLRREGLESLLEISGRGSGKALAVIITLVVVALWACSYGIAVLCGRAGKLEILGQMLPAHEASPERERDLGTEVLCDRCQRPVPPGSANCPYCGLRQAS